MDEFKNNIKSIVTKFLDKFKFNKQVTNQLPSKIDEYIEKNIGNMQQFTNDNKSRKAITSEIFKELNYDGLPKLANGKEFDTLVNDSKYGTIYRGIAADSPEQAEEYVNQFKKGELYVGGSNASIRGTGVYTCYGDDKAAKDYATNGGTSNNSAIIEMALDSEARVIEYNKLVEEQNKTLDGMAKRFSKYDKSIVDFNSLTTNLDKINNESDLEKANFISKHLSNSGNYAAINGYDAIDDEDKKYLIILNREKVTCKDDDRNIEDKNMSQNVHAKPSLEQSVDSNEPQKSNDGAAKTRFIEDLEKQTYSEEEIINNTVNETNVPNNQINEQQITPIDSGMVI